MELNTAYRVIEIVWQIDQKIEVAQYELTHAVLSVSMSV